MRWLRGARAPPGLLWAWQLRVGRNLARSPQLEFSARGDAHCAACVRGSSAHWGASAPEVAEAGVFAKRFWDRLLSTRGLQPSSRSRSAAGPEAAEARAAVAALRLVVAALPCTLLPVTPSRSALSALDGFHSSRHSATHSRHGLPETLPLPGLPGWLCFNVMCAGSSGSDACDAPPAEPSVCCSSCLAATYCAAKCLREDFQRHAHVCRAAHGLRPLLEIMWNVDNGKR